MIVTVTLNAALDVAYEAEGLSWHATCDVSRVRHRAGGRGVAVARVLHTFGHEVLAAGLTGGAAGELIREDLGRSGIRRLSPRSAVSRAACWRSPIRCSSGRCGCANPGPT